MDWGENAEQVSLEETQVPSSTGPMLRSEGRKMFLVAPRCSPTPRPKVHHEIISRDTESPYMV